MPELPAKAVKDVLAADPSLAGETIRIGRPNDTPDRGIWCLATGGFGNVPLQGDEDLRRPTVQVICRGERQQHASVAALADTAFDAINRTVPTGYTSANCLADPIPLTDDPNGRPLIAFNVSLVIIK